MEQKSSGVKTGNIDPNSPLLINGAPTAIHIKVNNKKFAQNCFQPKDHILPTTTMNDNTNMDSAMAG